MDERLEFHNLLKTVLESNNIYFQPPSNILMQYPCIVYNRSDINQKFADDRLYSKKVKYIITLIDPNPDSIILEKIGSLPFTKFIRHFTFDGLNHDVFETYY